MGIEVSSLLLDNRKLFLYGEINTEVAYELNKELVALDLTNHDPITLHINSEGGSVVACFSILNTINSLTAPIITICDCWAVSCGGLLFLAGKKRLMYKNSWWMGHDLSSENNGKTETIKNMLKYRIQVKKQFFDYIKSRCNLAKQDYDIIDRGELWLSAKQCLKKGICDKII